MTDTAYLCQDGLSPFDLEHLTEIIREGAGDWFHARLMRALHDLLPRIWYNDPTVEGRAA